MTAFLIVNIIVLVLAGLVARYVGKQGEGGGGWNFNYSTRDIVILAVITAIAGVVITQMGNVWFLANSSLGPMGGALLQGAFMWAYVLAMWRVRKPGAAPTCTTYCARSAMKNTGWRPRSVNNGPDRSAQSQRSHGGHSWPQVNTASATSRAIPSCIGFIRSQN